MLRFISAFLGLGVELAMLWAYGAWGFHLAASLPLRIAAALAFALAVAVAWGRFLAPRAPRRLPVPARAACKLILFTGAVAAAWSMDQVAFAIAIGAAAAVSLILEYVAGIAPA